MYPDSSKPKDYEIFLLSQCATCSIRFHQGSQGTTKLQVLRNEGNSSDYEEITNIDVLSFVYGIPSSILTSNLMSNLQDFDTSKEYAEMRADLLTITNLPDIATSLSLALCQSCAPKLTDLYDSHKAFLKNLAVDSFVSKATNVTPTSCNTQILPHNINTDTEVSEKFPHIVKLENESPPIDDYTTFSDSEHFDASPHSSQDPLLLEPENKINIVEKPPSSGESKDKTSSRKVSSFIRKKRHCQDCDIQFTSDYAVSVHKMEIHDGLGLDILRQKVKGPPFICPLAPCEKRFTTQQSVKYHCLHRHRVKLQVTNYKEKPSFCSICRFSFLKRSGLLLHQSKVHPEGIDKEVHHGGTEKEGHHEGTEKEVHSEGTEREVHSEGIEKEVHPEGIEKKLHQIVNKQATVKCHRCQSEFKSLEGLQKHGLESHAPKIVLERQKVAIGTKVRCLQCQVTYHDIRELNTHCENQHQSKHAQEIKKEFTETTSDFNENSNDSENSFLNDDDSQQFNSDEESNSINGPPYQCPQCSTSFKRLESLNGHCRRVHKLQLPLQGKYNLKLNIGCTICSVKFDNLAGWKNHNRYSHKLPCVCDHCYKAFESEKLLRIHVKDDHPDKIYSNMMNSQKTVNIRGKPQKQKVKRIRNRRKTVLSYKDGSVYDFYCKTCDRCWKSVQELKAHNQCCHNSWKKFFCIECDSEHKNLNLLWDHSLKKHNKKINMDEKISCSECELTFTKATELEKHVAEVHKIVKCSDCPKNFSSLEFLEIHSKRHTDDFPNNRCEFCEKDFLTVYTLQAHQRHVHFKELMLPEINAKCPFCEKTYKWKSHVNKHILMHHALEKPHKCEKCNKSFANRNLLSSHIKRAHETEKRFQCPHCDKSFSFIGPFKQHLVKHSDVRPFACDICEKRFKREFELRIHMDVHGPQEKKFFCEKCGDGFKRKGHFHLHMKKHEDLEKEDASFDCQVCGIKLKHSQSLKLHMKWKHPPAGKKGKHFCELCNKKFKNRERLSRHNERKHSNGKELRKKTPREEENLNLETSSSSVCELLPSNSGLSQPSVSTAPILHPLPLPMHHASSIPYPPLNYNPLDNCSSQYFHI